MSVDSRESDSPDTKLVNRSTLWAALGPGILMAGAAVGVSHLVQSTRAGAEYGFLLLGLVLLACLLKYPFLEFGPRYAAATGETMLRGYRRMGRWAIITYAVITAATFWVILASVTIATAGLAGVVFGVDLPISVLAAGVLVVVAALLGVGQFRALDLSMKIIMSVLAVSTLSAVVVAVVGMPETQGPIWVSPDALWTAAGIAFVLALLGWMPIPLDVAVWHSLWTKERARDTNTMPSVKHAVRDFQIGYLGATLLAAAFLTLGALVVFGGTGFATTAVGFSDQLVGMYSATLGDWSRPVITIAALTTMFSTTLAVADAYPRVIAGIVREVRTASPDTTDEPATPRATYAMWLGIVIVGGWAIIQFFGAQFTTLIDFATTVSFLAAPVLAWMNLNLITGPHTPVEARPGRYLRALSWVGIAFLVVFCIAWAWWRI